MPLLTVMWAPLTVYSVRSVVSASVVGEARQTFMRLVLMPEIDEILSRLAECHQVSLRWLVTHLDVERAWPGTLSYGTLLASKAKCIYKRGGAR